jgi:hypothetical protein
MNRLALDRARDRLADLADELVMVDRLSGKKQDDFLIAGSAPAIKANGRKKARKPCK